MSRRDQSRLRNVTAGPACASLIGVGHGKTQVRQAQKNRAGGPREHV